MPRLKHDVWRLALLWHGTVLDVVTVKRSRATLTLRTGDALKARVVDGMVELTPVRRGSGAPDPRWPMRVEPGALVDLPAGHAIVATRALPEANAGKLTGFDGTLFHAAMVGAAVQACVVSALVLAPRPQLDPDAGGGVRGDFRRLLVMGGTAPQQGPAQVAVVGRAPEEAERVVAERTNGTQPRKGRTDKGLTLEQMLDEMKRQLHLGTDGVAMKEAVGELARLTAFAPELGAGLGGLVPKEPPAVAVGSGLVGIGESRLQEVLREQVEKAKRDDRLMKRPDRAPIPVQLVDVPEAHVTTVSAMAVGLDPEVRDHLTDQVRERHNSVRHCYESYGLAGDPTRAGRLVLEITLQPSGRVSDARVEVDNPRLNLVGECVAKMASEWYLGDGLVEEPQRLSFPFVLQPRAKT